MIFNNSKPVYVVQKVMRTKPLGFSFNVQVHLYLVVTILFHIVNFGTADRLLGVLCFLGGNIYLIWMFLQPHFKGSALKEQSVSLLLTKTTSTQCSE